MSLFPGKIVMYRWRAGQVRAGNVDAAAMVTRVYADGTADLTVYPALDRDPVYQDRVHRMSDTVLTHCWHPTRDEERVLALEARLAQMEEYLARLSSEVIEKTKTAPKKVKEHLASG